MPISSSLLRKSYPTKNDIIQCVSEESATHEIKKVEMHTYSERAEEFTAAHMLNLPPAEHRSLEPLRHLPPKALILELGGGDARFGFALMKEGYTVIESDIAPGTVEKVKEIAEKKGIMNGHYAVIDAEDLPFVDNSLDAVLMVATFHHLPNPTHALKEFNRVLKPGGTLLLLREPALWQYVVFGPLYWLLRKLLRAHSHHAISHADDETHGFTRKKIRSLLQPFFKDITLVPVQYIEKYYLNYLILKSKILKQECVPHEGLSKFLQDIDGTLARLPVLKNTTWDWDIVAKK